MFTHPQKALARATRLSLLIAAAAAVMAASAVAAQPQAPSVPTTIQVGAGHKVFLAGHAEGVQIYRCNTTATGGHAWGLLAPRANLYDDKGKVIMTHFGGPSWQARDGSTVVGKRVDGVTVDPTAIPWLLISADSATAGADGDKLMKTTFIQRTATTGGLAPAAATCNAETVGDVEEIAYTADYHFWKKG
jgi:hypothetical protein